MAQLKLKGLCQLLLLLLMTSIASGQAPQCPNNLAIYNPNLRTACVNGSTQKLFILTYYSLY